MAGETLFVFLLLLVTIILFVSEKEAPFVDGAIINQFTKIKLS